MTTEHHVQITFDEWCEQEIPGDSAESDIARVFAHAGWKAREKVAEAEKAELVAALVMMRKLADKAASLNDSDHVAGNAIKAHKILCALAGWVRGYMAETDVISALIAKYSTNPARTAEQEPK